MNKLRFIGSVVCIALSLATKAQEKGQPATITKDQAAKINMLQKELDGKIIAAFKGNEKLRMEMEQDIKNLNNIKDEKAQYAAAAAYQKKHMGAYNEILKKGGVDFSSVARQLQNIMPFYKFGISNNMISGLSRRTPPGTTTPPGPKSKKINDFNTHKEKSCGAASGGDVTFSNTSVNNYTLAAIAGGCSASGDMEAAFNTGQVSSAKITVSYKGRVDGFAVGVGGTASSYALCGADVEEDEVFYVSGFYLAPFLWVAFGEEEVNETKTINLSANKDYKLRFFNQQLYNSLYQRNACRR